MLQSLSRGWTGFGDENHASFHGWGAMAQRQAASVEVDPGRSVLAAHELEGLAKDLAEFTNRAVMPAKLISQRRPSNERRLARVDPVQPLCQPTIGIESHGVVRQGGDRPLIERYGMPLQAREVVEGEAYGRWP